MRVQRRVETADEARQHVASGRGGELSQRHALVRLCGHRSPAQQLREVGGVEARCGHEAALTDGLAYADNADSGERTVFSANFACPESGFTIDEIEPRLFSFNNPFGACPACDGLGVSSHFDEQLVVPDHRQTLRGGAIAPWANSSSRYYIQTLESLARQTAARVCYRVKSVEWF